MGFRLNWGHMTVIGEYVLEEENKQQNNLILNYQFVDKYTKIDHFISGDMNSLIGNVQVPHIVYMENTILIEMTGV